MQVLYAFNLHTQKKTEKKHFLIYLLEDKHIVHDDDTE